MRITESRIRQIIREEAYRVIREHDALYVGGEGEFDDFGGEEEEGEEMTVDDVIERYKDEGARSWMRVSNDFHEMADGGMDDILEKYYPGLTAEDCATIAAELDSHFGLD